MFDAATANISRYEFEFDIYTLIYEQNIRHIHIISQNLFVIIVLLYFEASQAGLVCCFQRQLWRAANLDSFKGLFLRPRWDDGTHDLTLTSDSFPKKLVGCSYLIIILKL